MFDLIMELKEQGLHETLLIVLVAGGERWNRLLWKAAYPIFAENCNEAQMISFEKELLRLINLEEKQT